MSEPKRLNAWGKEVPDGDYIRYEDYARLKANVERLIWASQGSVKYVDHTMALARQATKHHKEIESLELQVERLTKAGDMCDQLLACFEMEGRRGVNIGRDMWREAKGVQP